MHFGVALGAGKPAAFRTAQEGKQRTAAAGGQRGIGEEYRALAKHAPANVRQPLLSTTLAAANRQCMAVPGEGALAEELCIGSWPRSKRARERTEGAF